jgi:peroxiredoxin
VSDPLQRLDPDRAAASREASLPAGAGAPGAGGASAGPPPAPVSPSVRRYRRLIGAIGLVLVLGISIYQLAANRGGTIGIPAGQRLHWFSAPLAASDLNGDANPAPPCTLERHDPRALNVCLLAARGPLVLAFFVTASGTCVREIDVLQALAPSYERLGVQFAAVALDSSHAAAAKLIRTHHWTIPVAYDADGTVAGLYRVAVCPMLELARRGGVVADRLIGDPWLRPATLGPRIRALAAASG